MASPQASQTGPHPYSAPAPPLTDGVEQTDGQRAMPVQSGDTRAGHTCTVSVVSPHSQVDITVPAQVPVAALVPELVELIRARRPDISAPDTPAPEGSWRIGRIGHPPLDPERTLADQAIVDGTLLHLQPTATAAPEPLFDDVIDAVATVGAAHRTQWDPRAARLVSQGIAVATALTAAAVLLLPSLGRDAGRSSVVPQVLTAGACALAAMAACAVVSRIYRNPGVGAVLGYCALPFAFAAGLLAPHPQPGPPGVLLGTALASGCAVVCARASGAVLVHTAVASFGILTSAVAGVSSVTGAGASTAGSALMIGAAGMLSIAPRLTLLVGRLPMPPVPSRDVRADLDGDITAVEGPSPALVGAAARSGGLLAGLAAGAAAASVVGSAVAVRPDGPIVWPAVALALATAAVLTLRGRAYADLAPAAVLIIGGALTALTTTLAVTVGLAGAAPVAAPAIAVPAAGACCAAAAPIALSPLVRRAVEIIEYLLIASLIPLALWVMGAYSAMRAL